VRLVAGGLLILILGLKGRAQAPSVEEQQYLFSVLPLIETGELSNAEKRLLSGIEQYPRSAILYNALGIVYHKQTKIDKAAASFRKAIEILPSFTAAQLQLASIYQERGNRTEAAQLYRSAGDGTTNFDALAAAGLGLAECEDYAGAARVLERAHALRPDAESVKYNLALAQYKSGNPASALESLQSIAAERQPDVLHLRGKVLEGLGKAEGAVDLTTACRLEPGNEVFCADAALADIRQERFLDAIAVLEPSLEKSKGSLSMLPLMGLAQFRLGRYHDAMSSYTAALQEDPSVDPSREGLGFLCYVTGDLEKARAVIEEGLKNPNADFYLAHLDAMVLYRLSPQLRSNALDAVGRALRANGQFAPSYFLRGKIRMDQNDFAGALGDFEHAVELDPKYPLPYYKMAQIYTRQGRTREAEAARRKFSALGNLREEEILLRQTQNILLPGPR
jgi:tetratricopeptide (TPR) repeat protein